MATSPRQVASEMKGGYIIITVTVNMTVIPHPQHTSLLDFFNPWTTTVCRTVNKADSCWEWRQHVHWSVTHPCRPTPLPPTSTTHLHSISYIPYFRLMFVSLQTLTSACTVRITNIYVPKRTSYLCHCLSFMHKDQNSNFTFKKLSSQ